MTFPLGFPDGLSPGAESCTQKQHEPLLGKLLTNLRWSKASTTTTSPGPELAFQANQATVLPGLDPCLSFPQHLALCWP